MSYALNSIEAHGDDFILSHHDVYWVKRDGSRVLVCRAGDLIQHARLDRFPKLDYETKIETQKIFEIANFIRGLIDCKRPKDKMNLVKQLRENWNEYFLGHEKLSNLEIILLSELLVPEKMKVHAHSWASSSMMLFQRSCYIATLSMMGAMNLGYASWAYLVDLWESAFSLSTQYSLSGISQTTLPCLEQMRNGEKEVSIHCNFEDANFPSIKELSSMLFEKADGSGNPRGLHVVEMNHVERWYGHLQKSIPWNADVISESEWVSKIWNNDEFKILNKILSNKKIVSQSNDYMDFGL